MVQREGGGSRRKGCNDSSNKMIELIHSSLELNRFLSIPFIVGFVTFEYSSAALFTPLDISLNGADIIYLFLFLFRVNGPD